MSGLAYYMIPSEIWDKSTRVNVSKASQIALACRVSAI